MFDIALMPVTREWLPYEGLDEREMLRVAVAAQRKFVKGLRVDLEADRTIASITLTDTVPNAVAVRLAGDGDLEIADDALAAFLATHGVDHFAWRPGDSLPNDTALIRRTQRPFDPVDRPVREPLSFNNRVA